MPFRIPLLSETWWSSPWWHFSWAISLKLFLIMVWYFLCWNIWRGNTMPAKNVISIHVLRSYFRQPISSPILITGLVSDSSVSCTFLSISEVVSSSRGDRVGSWVCFHQSFRRVLECFDTSIPPLRCRDLSLKNEVS